MSKDELRIREAIARANEIASKKLSDKTLSDDARNHWLSYKIAVDNIREWSGIQAFV